MHVIAAPRGHAQDGLPCTRKRIGLHRFALDDAGVAVRRLAPWRVTVDQANGVAALLQRQRGAHTDNAGAQYHYFGTAGISGCVCHDVLTAVFKGFRDLPRGFAIWRASSCRQAISSVALGAGRRSRNVISPIGGRSIRTERADGMGLLVEEAKWRLDAMIECDFVAGEQVICFSAHPPISPICRAPLFPTSHMLILVF